MYDDDSIVMYKERLQNVVRISKAQDVCIYIPPLLEAKFKFFISEADGEIGGLGKARQLVVTPTQCNYLVETLDLLVQDASPAEVQLNSLEVMKWMDENYPGWKETNDKPPVFFWHSHVNMGVTFSMQDDYAIGALVAMGGVVLSAVGNKRDEFSARVDFNVPIVGTHIELPAKLKVAPLQWLTDEDEAELRQEMADKVRERSYSKGGGTSFFDRERERLEKQAAGTGKVAQAAKDRLAQLDKDEKSWNKHTSHGSGYSHHGGYQKSKVSLERPCLHCGQEIDTWEKEGVKVCYYCRKERV